MRILSFDCAERTLGICLMTINKLSVGHQDITREQNKIKQSLNCLINYDIEKITQMIQSKDKFMIVEFATTLWNLMRSINTINTMLKSMFRSIVVEFANVYDLSPEGGGVLRMEEIARRLKCLLDGFHNNFGAVDSATIEAQPTVVGMGGASKVNLRAIHMQAYITYYYANLGAKVISVSPKSKNNIYFTAGLDYDTLRANNRGDNKKIRKLHASKNFAFWLEISGQSRVANDISPALLNHAADAFMQVMAICCRNRTLLTGLYE